MRTALATGLCLVALAGCSGGGDDDGDRGNDARSSSPAPLTLPSEVPESSAAATTSGTPPAAPTNARGNVESDLGEPVAIAGEDGRPAVVFVIDDVVAGLECTGRDAAPPGEGYFIGVRIRVTTGDLSPLGGTWGMAPNDWGIADSEGGTNFNVVDEAATTCLDPPEKFPTDPLRSNQEVSGTFVLNSPTETGTVLFSTPAVPGRGWEWRF
jgi:hypothetical protein